jgi:ligand-binding sensor domain-containing protein
MLNDQILINKEIPAVTRFDLDNNTTPYLATYDKRVLKVNKDLSYDQFLEIPKINYIQKMLFDNENRLWVASYLGGLFYYDGKDTARYNTSNSILSSNSVQWLTMDSESNIWFIQGTELFKIDNNLRISKDPNLLPINNPTGAIFISADKNNALWVSKADAYGERLFKKDTNGPWTEIIPPTSASNRPLKFIKADNNGTIWIAYSDYPKDILAYYDTNRWVEIKIPLDKVIILDAVTYKNQLILGTSKGIYPMVLE